MYTLMDVYKMDGIKDLPMAVRVPFAKAWLFEYNGDPTNAGLMLDVAVEAEARILATPTK